MVAKLVLLLDYLPPALWIKLSILTLQLIRRYQVIINWKNSYTTIHLHQGLHFIFLDETALEWQLADLKQTVSTPGGLYIVFTQANANTLGPTECPD